MISSMFFFVHREGLNRAKIKILLLHKKNSALTRNNDLNIIDVKTFLYGTKSKIASYKQIQTHIDRVGGKK